MTVVSSQEPQTSRKLSALLRLMASIGGARVAGAGLGFLGQVLLARWLGAEALGTYFLALSLAALLAIVACLGLPSVAVRFISRYRMEGANRHLTGFVDTSRLYAIGGLSAGLLVGFTAIFHFASAGTTTALLLGTVTAVPLAMMRLNGAFANAFRQFHSAYLPDLLGRPATIVCLALLLPVVGFQASLELLLLMHLLAAAGLAVWQRERVNRTIRALRAQISSDATTEVPSKTWIAAGLPLVPVALFTAAFADVAILVIAPSLATDELAVFAVSLKIALLTGFGTQLVHQLILPDMADAYANGHIGELQRRIRQANLVTFALCSAMTIVFVIGGDILLSVFGGEFADGHLALVVLSLGLVAKSILGPGSHMLVLAGEEGAAVLASAFGVGVLLLAALIVVPMFGILGASVAVFISMTIWSGIAAWQSASRARIAVAGF